jgi:hypothetical protein
MQSKLVLVAAVMLASLAGCATEADDAVDDLGALGDGKADGFSATRTLDLKVGERKTFGLTATTAFRAWAKDASSDNHGRLELAIISPDGADLTSPPHPSPEVVAPRPAASAKYSVIITNVGDVALTGVQLVVKSQVAEECYPAERANACGGCGPLPFEPGQSCGCGNAVARCGSDGSVTCNAEPTMQAETTDGQDDWIPFRETFHVGPSRTSTTTFSVFADDTFGGLLQPELRYLHPGGFSGQICMWVKDWALHTSPVNCDGGLSIYSSGCCKDFDDQPQLVEMGLSLNLGVPSPLGEDFTWDVRLDGRLRNEITPQVCTPVLIEYRF